MKVVSEVLQVAAPVGDRDPHPLSVATGWGVPERIDHLGKSSQTLFAVGVPVPRGLFATWPVGQYRGHDVVEYSATISCRATALADMVSIGGQYAHVGTFVQAPAVDDDFSATQRDVPRDDERLAALVSCL